MILVDTSVWIKLLAGREPFKTELERLLHLGAVAGHELVFGELLIGDRGGRRRFLTAYAIRPYAPNVPHAEVVAFVRDRRVHGRGVGWIDIHLLASALVGRMKLWTADPRFAQLADELGVAYKVWLH